MSLLPPVTEKARQLMRRSIVGHRESPRFGCSVLTGRSLKQIERDGAKKVLRRPLGGEPANRLVQPHRR
jgi:hypothetical protein